MQFKLKPFSEIYKGKRVFITGHTGFKGAWLSQWLLELGAKVAGYSAYIPSNPSLYEVLNLSDKISDYSADITDIHALKNAINTFQPEIIFHLAAQPIVSESYLDPVKTFFVNSIGMANLLQVIREIKSVQAGVFITSDKCYENVEWEYGYRESDQLGGKDPYSASKACAEIIFSSYIRSFFNSSDREVYFSTTRAGNVIGGGDWAKDRIVPDCFRSWSIGKNVSIRNPNSTRPWQHVLEPLNGYLHLGANLLEKRSELHGESFNFGPSSDSNYTVEKLIRSLGQYWEGRSYDLSNDSVGFTKNIKEAGLLKLCCDKALSYLNWTPTLNFNETVDYTSLWYKNYYENNTNMIEFTKKQIMDYSLLSAERKKAWVTL